MTDANLCVSTKDREVAMATVIELAEYEPRVMVGIQETLVGMARCQLS